MPFTHTTRRGRIYYLHIGAKRGGGVQHFVSTKPKGPLVDAVPEGFEIYETVNGQVYFRRKKPALIHDVELACARRELKKLRGPNFYQVEIDRDAIVVHESDRSLSSTVTFPAWRPVADMEAIDRKFATYMPVMRFVLEDKSQRLFRPERFCFRGSVEDWISIGTPDKIEKLAAKYIPHLGRDSFYELY